MTTEVFVLGVVHDDHANYEGYTFWHLIKIMDHYRPDLIMIETGSRAIAEGDFRSHSPEKWGVILPWGVERGIQVAGLDGDPVRPTKPLVDPDAELVKTEEGKRRVAELEAKVSALIAEVGDYPTLTNTYEQANSERTQGLFRQTHTLCEEALGVGPQSFNWTPRNRSMVKRTIEAIKASDAKRVLVTVGCEHKYALDDMFAEIDGIKVLQLADFLSGPIELTEQEQERFRQGDSPIVYPNDLMLVHRRLHGGEPYSYTQSLYPKPDSLDVSGLLEAIEACLARENDPKMHYYRGLYFYYTKQYTQAAAEFDLARQDRADTFEGVMLWELATLRGGQMLDLAGHRQEAMALYEQVLSEGFGFVRVEAERYLAKPFTRPSS